MRHFAIIGTLGLGHVHIKFGHGRVYGAEMFSSEHSRKILGAVLVFEESETRCYLDSVADLPSVPGSSPMNLITFIVLALYVFYDLRILVCSYM